MNIQMNEFHGINIRDTQIYKAFYMEKLVQIN